MPPDHDSSKFSKDLHSLQTWCKIWASFPPLTPSKSLVVDTKGRLRPPARQFSFRPTTRLLTWTSEGQATTHYPTQLRQHTPTWRSQLQGLVGSAFHPLLALVTTHHHQVQSLKLRCLIHRTSYKGLTKAGIFSNFWERMYLVTLHRFVEIWSQKAWIFS